MATLRLPLILFWGRFFTWLPYRRPLSVVYGTPIPIQQTDNPTQQQIDEIYQIYFEAIKGIFHRYKSQYGYSNDEELVIVPADSADM